MTVELTVEEKTTIVNQHMQNVAYSLYNSQISLVEANAVSSPNQANVDAINAQIADSTSQLNALQAQLDTLPASTPASN
jgi:hypothetical protein